VAAIATVGVIYASLITLRQIDMKRIIAYSSVAHMNMAMVSLCSLNAMGVYSSIYLMLSHGLIASGLFFLVGFLYNRFHVRSVYYYGGLATIMPVLGFFFFLFTLANMAFPLTSGFIGEFLLLLGISMNNFYIAFLNAFSMLFTTVYSVLLFGRVFLGELKPWFENMVQHHFEKNLKLTAEKTQLSNNTPLPFQLPSPTPLSNHFRIEDTVEKAPTIGDIVRSTVYHWRDRLIYTYYYPQGPHSLILREKVLKYLRGELFMYFRYLRLDNKIYPANYKGLIQSVSIFDIYYYELIIVLTLFAGILFLGIYPQIIFKYLHFSMVLTETISSMLLQYPVDFYSDKIPLLDATIDVSDADLYKKSTLFAIKTIFIKI
jgi:NADH:ubiquinone oxidoreductase subunit 5 (subunit L)/multisubunit Na+/H+ antiporter MnhA subunit